ncbi:hypothetical protein C4D60_Mb08t09870 [Musa balbisiana]|uniref:CG-1 domain-containing protein n=1 Tax=Musa balbisiana TaxID=52838 RepID=A0A4S8K2Q4_MUSBA|nr:hypothetical protein C4D60_Mb08t09870 [Musa balbisiana]
MAPIGNEERIHVYYARSEDDPNFYRRCYWLLDRDLERIVLVHYRQTSEDNAFQHVPASVECKEVVSATGRVQYGSPSTPVNSAGGSAQSEVSGHTFVSEEINSIDYNVSGNGSGTSVEKMAAALLSAGANPSLVTDPTTESPGGRTAADLASKQGYEGLAAYLAEKGLSAHFEAMSLSGNITTQGRSISATIDNSENLSEQELCLKESLAAYRNAADAADRIQSAMRERALKLQTKAVQLVKPEMEATQIIAALKIQHAFHNYNRRKMMKAAARIQSHFRTWKTRRDYINMRKKAIKIQATFRGHQVRRQYRKIVWSVGVLEKAVLRWRLKRKGLRGIQVEATKEMKVDTMPESTGEEEFFRISRKQAEERVQRSVVRVQAMFRSYRAQQEYRRMKMAHEQAELEFCDIDQLQ